MPGVMIYTDYLQYNSFTAVDDAIFKAMRENLPGNGYRILWVRGEVSVGQIDESEEIRHRLVRELNEGLRAVDHSGETEVEEYKNSVAKFNEDQKAKLERELSQFFE